MFPIRIQVLFDPIQVNKADSLGVFTWAQNLTILSEPSSTRRADVGRKPVYIPSNLDLVVAKLL